MGANDGTASDAGHGGTNDDTGDGDLAIAMLPSSEVELLEQIVSYKHDVAVYRDLLRDALAQVQSQVVQLDRLGGRLVALVDENRALRYELSVSEAAGRAQRGDAR